MTRVAVIAAGVGIVIVAGILVWNSAGAESVKDRTVARTDNRDERRSDANGHGVVDTSDQRRSAPVLGVGIAPRSKKVRLSSTDVRAGESDGVYELRMTIRAAVEEFLRDANLSSEQERAVFGIIADAQANAELALKEAEKEYEDNGGTRAALGASVHLARQARREIQETALGEAAKVLNPDQLELLKSTVLMRTVIGGLGLSKPFEVLD